MRKWIDLIAAHDESEGDVSDLTRGLSTAR